MLPNFIGFEDLFKQMETLSKVKVPNWPPYNIRKVDENRYVIEMALAGFSTSDVEVSLEKDQLVIRGNASNKDADGEYLYRGIATRAFERSFRVSDNIVIKNASMLNGVLKVFYETASKYNDILKIPVKSEE